MPRPLEQINADLQAKQAEIQELTTDPTFRETVDNVADDLGEVTDFLDETSTGIEQAGEDLGENFEQLKEAVEGLQDLLGTDAFSESLEASGEFTEGVQGGLESVNNVVGEVQGGLESLNEALEAFQQIDDLRTAEGAEALEAFADAFEAVVDHLGPLVDKVPVLGPFFRLYAAGIRNIAVSAGQIEAIVGRNQSLYQQISPGHSLYLTPDYLASERLRRLEAEYESLLEEAMEAAAAEREARDASPESSDFDPVEHVVHTAMDRCRGLLPDYNSDAFRRWLRTKIALDSARENHGSAMGGVEMARWDGSVDAAHAQELLDSASARLNAAQEAFGTEGAEHQQALNAYDDCVKSRIHEFSIYEGLDDWQIRRIGTDYPRWDMTGWEPPVQKPARAVDVPRQVSMGHRRDAVMAVLGGALLAGGLLTIASAVPGQIAGAAGAVVNVTPSAATSSPFARQVTVDVPQPAVSAGGDQGDASGSGEGEPVEPAVGSVCNGTDHYPAVPATDGDGNTINSPSKQVIGAYFTGLPPLTRIMMEVSGIEPTAGVVNADGYAEFQLPLYSYGTYAIMSVTANVGGSPVEFDPALFGSPFTVGDPEQDCGQSSLTAPTTTTTTSTTTTTTTALSATETVPAGGGAVEFPAEITATSTPTAVNPGSPGSPGKDADPTTVALGLGLAACGATLLGGAGSPGMSTVETADGPSSGSRTFTAEDRDLLQEIYRGADQAGFRIAGISSIKGIEDVLAGSKDDPVVIGKSATLTLRVGPDGSLLPRSGDTDKAATSILEIDVRPSVEFDSAGDSHVVWNAYVQQIDVATSRIVETSKAGPSSEEWNAKVGGRSNTEVGNDPDFKDWVVESMPSSPSAAAQQALERWTPEAPR